MFRRRKMPWYWILLELGLLLGTGLAVWIQSTGGLGQPLWGESLTRRFLLIRQVPGQYLAYIAPRRMGLWVLTAVACKLLAGRGCCGVLAVFQGCCTGLCLGLLAAEQGFLAPACFLCLSFPHLLLYILSGWLLWCSADGRRRLQREEFWQLAASFLLTIVGIVSEIWINPWWMEKAEQFF